MKIHASPSPQAPTVTEVLVCTTCRSAGQARDETAAGQVLWEAVQRTAEQAAPWPDTLRLRGFACLNSCSRACAVAFQAAGKHSYCFGDLQADATTAAQVLACAQQHALSSDGNLPRNERPERLRGGILLRLPPLVDQVRSQCTDATALVAPAVAGLPAT
jgi:predicted metal-binding protein